jgi:hypothetical protein
VQVDIGPNTNFPYGYMMRGLTGQNQGDYYITGQTGLDITFFSRLAISGDPVTGAGVQFTAAFGVEYLQIASVNKTTASEVKVRGTAAANYFGPTDPGVYGKSLYFKLPQIVNGLSQGDLLQLYGFSYASPSIIAVIDAVEADIIKLNIPLNSDVSWNFSPTATVPFARLHTGHVFDFSSYQVKLGTWAARLEQQDAYFTDLFRLVNPILANSSPTQSQINDVVNKLGTLYRNLNQAGSAAFNGTTGDDLQTIILGYFVDHQPSVDAMLRAFREKGADRAVDLILAGHFQDFFGLTPQTSSYAGAVQAAATAVALNDLPMKKTNRKDASTSRLLASSQGQDPEYNLSDTEQDVPDPVGPGVVGE